MMTLSPRTLILFCLLSTVACAHGHRGAQKQRTQHNVATPVDTALLHEGDVRLITEALAYDVTHGSWMAAALGDGAEVAPMVFVGEVPTAVPPSSVPFPKQVFVENLVQSLRNTNKVTVLPGPDGHEPPIWRLDVTVQHDALVVEGEQTRGYSIDASLRLLPSLTSAWSKHYALRKRLRPVAAEFDLQAAPVHGS